MTDQLDPKISLITKLLLVVLSPAAADGEWNNAFEALQRTLKEVDPGGHGLVERLKTPATPPLSQDDLREAYSIGYQDCAKEIEQRRSNAIAVTTPRSPRDLGGECKASRWVSNPADLAALMTKIQCMGGLTQIERVLTAAVHETMSRKIDALVFVGDCCEEPLDRLVTAAARLGALNVPAFMFQEGHDPEAELHFRKIAERTHGAYHRFDQGSARQLGDLLRAVASFAVGGIAALEKQGSEASRLLLRQIR